MVNKDKIYSLAQKADLQVDRIVKYDGKDYVPFGDKNQFPQQSAKLSRESVNHRAILNSKTIYCEGSKFMTDDTALEDFLNANDFKDGVHHNSMFDFLSGGNGWVEVVTDGVNLLRVFHHDHTTVRIEKSGIGVIIHPDWMKDKGEKDDRREYVALYPNYTRGEDRLLHSMYHIKDYEPEFNFYGVPSWFAGLRAARISKKTNEFNDERLDNKFSIDGMLVVPGIESVTEAEKFEKKLQKYQGSDQAGKVLPHYLQSMGAGDTREKAEFIPFNQTVDGVFMDLHRQSDEDLIKIHSWYRSLAAFGDNTGFDTQRIVNEYKMALASTIGVIQNKFLKCYNTIFSDFGYGELTIFNQSPVYVPDNCQYIWEVRRDKGLDYDENDPKQNEFYKTIA
jgi:hypothetical protein